MSFVLAGKPRPYVTQITLNRPERINAMAFDVMIPFREAVEEAGRDNETRVLIVTGAGSGFCSGADLESAGTVPNIDGLTRSSIALRSMSLLDDVIHALRKVPQPVIGAINGPAIGGGFCLSLATDIRIASESAYFRAAGINNGLTAAELGHTPLVWPLCGPCSGPPSRLPAETPCGGLPPPFPTSPHNTTWGRGREQLRQQRLRRQTGRRTSLRLGRGTAGGPFPGRNPGRRQAGNRPAGMTMAVRLCRCPGRGR
jgi:hypothetical protein